MHLTHVLLFAVCLAGAIPRAAANASVPSPDDVPPNLVLDGLEVPDSALRAAVRPYLEFRPTTFQDWHPSRRGMLVLSREGQTPQLHEVRVPSGRRRPIAAFSERVAGGAYAPGSGDPIVMMADRGGDEFYQLFRVAGSDNEPVLLTDGRSRNTGPRWSDRGTLLAYVSTRRNGRDTDLYVMDPRKPETDRRVAELPGGGWRVLDGSPDDRRLL
ncbi:MAG: PD40 domain-containing protein, partial [Verrucomicrobiales bacterium]|nr:PD40 domain-containing protein [Verrucomicrobiales bacterium]